MPTLNWIGKDKVINHHLDVPYKVLEHQYRFEETELFALSEFGKVGLRDSLDDKAAEIQQSTNPKNPNSDKEITSEFGKVGLKDSQDLDAAEIQQSTNLKNPNSDNEITSEFGKVGLKDSQDLDAAKIQQSTNPKNPNSDNHSDNKIIHGDNLEALKALLPEYEGKIKCIYIDPPYNTGNESWVYNDNVNDPKIKKWLGQVVGKEAEDLTRHDKWLCMMYPRLKLLHKLLADDGAIFISIDDNEQANLKLVMDEIFGGGNFINNVIWQKKYSPQNDARYFSDMHEFILTYSKNKSNWQRNLAPRKAEQDARYKNVDNDIRGNWKSSDLSVKTYNSNTDYPIETPSGRIVNPPAGYSWRVSKEKFAELILEDRIWFGKDGSNVPSIKRFLSDVQEGTVPVTLWLRDEVGDNQEEKQNLKKIFSDGSFPFDTPKPARLIEKILQISTDKNSIILDSFAGSGTTAHAVLNLNKQDGGNRKFILIEMENYAETITAERVKRVIKGYGNTKGTGGSFDYYTLGEPLFLEDGMLNEKLPLQKIRAYIWYTETAGGLGYAVGNGQNPQPKPDTSNPELQTSFLGTHQNTAYYFYYLPQEITTLDHDFLAAISIKAEQYLIYADNCLLTPNYMAKNSIVFKKIPRDIRRF